MKTAIYPGTFDPVTWGHLDLIQRAAKMVDTLIVGVSESLDKVPLIKTSERVELLKSALTCVPDTSNVTVKVFSGLLVNFARDNDSDVIIRGLRSVTDFNYEMQLEQANFKLSPSIQTIFLMSAPIYQGISSSIVKSIYRHGGDLSQFLPPVVIDYLKNQQAHFLNN